METMLGSAFEEHLPNLAAHAMAGEAWEKAADAAFRAGERAIDRSAYRDAASLFEMVLKALEKLPPQPDFVATAIDVRLRLRSSLHQDGNIDRIDTYLAEAEGLARSIEDKRRLALVNLHRSYVLSTAGKMPGALLAAEQALSFGKDLDDRDLIAEARLALGQANVMGGRFAVAFEVLKDLPQLFAGPRRGRRFGQMATRSLWCIALMSEALLGLSQFDEALRMAERAHGEAVEINRPLDITWAAKFLGNALMAQGRAGEAQEILRSGLALAQAYDIRLIQPWLALGLGHAAMLEGDAAASETWLAHAEA
jgi:tetratricopeptide (TPR) repeat protein